MIKFLRLECGSEVDRDAERLGNFIPHGGLPEVEAADERSIGIALDRLAGIVHFGVAQRTGGQLLKLKLYGFVMVVLLWLAQMKGPAQQDAEEQGQGKELGKITHLSCTDARSLADFFLEA